MLQFYFLKSFSLAVTSVCLFFPTDKGVPHLPATEGADAFQHNPQRAVHTQDVGEIHL